MDGLKLKIMTVVTQKPHQPFELYLTKPQNTHLDSVHRYNYGLMSMLKDFYNFTFVNRRTKSWGYLRNGKFDGMIGALSRREVDLGGSPMYFRQERHRVVSYTTRTFIERPCFIFRHPPRNDAVKNPFLLPFEIIVWYLMVGCGTFLVIVLCCSFFVEDAVPRMVPVHLDGDGKYATGYIRWIVVSSFLVLLFLLLLLPWDPRYTIAITRPSQQTYRRRIDPIRETETMAPNAIIKRKRYRKAFYSFSEACVNKYYSASIVGTLLMEQPKSIKTLRNLIDSRLTLGIEDIPYSRDYFVRTTDADSLELYRTRIDYYEPSTGRNESHFLAAADGLQLVRNGGYAFHVAISAAYRIIRLTFSEREICELSEIDMFPVWSQWMVAIVQKNSPYRDVITYG
uniref:Lig_chan-Glu_bd domain-containing protein n=1 Tax=Anopheles funestus TaxID=62324 RepID=A0A182RLG0_ANOFN